MRRIERENRFLTDLGIQRVWRLIPPWFLCSVPLIALVLLGGWLRFRHLDWAQWIPWPQADWFLIRPTAVPVWIVTVLWTVERLRRNPLARVPQVSAQTG